MVAQNEARTQVAQAFLPGAELTFYDDGTATWTAAHCFECTRCWAHNDLVGESITLAPNEAWGLLQAVHQSLEREAWQRASKAIVAALSGPQD